MTNWSELTKAQRRVLKILNESESYATKVSNEKGAVCTLHRGGDDERLDIRTLTKLHSLALVSQGVMFLTQGEEGFHYNITEIGMKLLSDTADVNAKYEHFKNKVGGK